MGWKIKSGDCRASVPVPRHAGIAGSYYRGCRNGIPLQPSVTTPWENAKFGVENPGYRKITKLYEVGGVAWDYVDIDGQGMKVEQLKQKGITVAHVSPEHHFPIGLVMPVGRRQELLRWAAEEPERYIVEDDFDCEFRMVGRPIPSVQSMDRNHRVIYINTFPKLWYRLYVSAIWCCRRS